MKKQSIHPRARTTPAIRKEIQEAPLSVSTAELARKYNINPNTARKWRKRSSVEDESHAAKRHWNQKLTPSDIQIILATRKHTGLALEDLLKVVTPQLSVSISRSRLAEILKVHGLTEKPKRETKEFATYEPGFIHIDCTYLPKIDGVQSKAFCAIDRVSKWVYVEVHECKTIEASTAFLKNLIAKCPWKIHRILTDNGAEFTYRLLPKAKQTQKTHPFDLICEENVIKHKLIQFRHPWTNGQVERFNRELKNKTVKRCKYESQAALKAGLEEWVNWYNAECQLKTLKGKTPNQFILDYQSNLTITLPDLTKDSSSYLNFSFSLKN